jgi:hypothetical protein
LGAALGWNAMAAFFSVRVAAIILTIMVVLIALRILSGGPFQQGAVPVNNGSFAPNPAARETKQKFWGLVAKASWRTMRRLIFYAVPTFALMAMIEYYGILEWLGDQMPGLFSLTFIPPQATVIIPAQAVNLYNGAVAAGNFMNEGVITARQAVVILIAGSVLTAPLRTLRHALPTYVGILGAKTGVIMAVSAQVLRCISVIICTYVLTLVWQ